MYLSSVIYLSIFHILGKNAKYIACSTVLIIKSYFVLWEETFNRRFACFLLSKLIRFTWVIYLYSRQKVLAYMYSLIQLLSFVFAIKLYSNCGRRDRMVVGFIITYAISAYQHLRCEFEPCSGEVHTLCYKVCQWLVTGLFFPVYSGSSTNKTDCHDITEILLKVAVNTINLYSNKFAIPLLLLDQVPFYLL